MNKPRKRIFYNKPLDCVYVETGYRTGVYKPIKKQSGELINGSLTDYSTVSKDAIMDRFGKPKHMWIDLSFYPAHTNQDFGQPADELKSGKIYWFHQYTGDEKEGKKVFKSYLVYMIERTNLVSYFRRINVDGTLQKKLIRDVGSGFYTEPKEHYKVVTTVKLI